MFIKIINTKNIKKKCRKERNLYVIAKVPLLNILIIDKPFTLSTDNFNNL